jgi:hypothetical protein
MKIQSYTSAIVTTGEIVESLSSINRLDSGNEIGNTVVSFDDVRFTFHVSEKRGRRVRAYYRHAKLRSPWAPSFHAVAAVEAARRGVPRFGSNAVNRPISGK